MGFRILVEILQREGVSLGVLLAEDSLGVRSVSSKFVVAGRNRSAQSHVDVHWWSITTMDSHSVASSPADLLADVLVELLA